MATENDLDAYPVDEFCRRHGICRATFYNAQKDGIGPRTMKVRGRTLISREAAADWRRQREAETATGRKAVAE